MFQFDSKTLRKSFQKNAFFELNLQAALGATCRIITIWTQGTTSLLGSKFMSLNNRLDVYLIAIRSVSKLIVTFPPVTVNQVSDFCQSPILSRTKVK